VLETLASLLPSPSPQLPPQPTEAVALHCRAFPPAFSASAPTSASVRAPAPWRAASSARSAATSAAAARSASVDCLARSVKRC